MQDSMTEPSHPLAVPPSVEDAPLSSPSRRYETRRPPTTPRVSSSHVKKSSSHPPKKKARVSAPLEPSKPQPPHPPATESQIPSGMTPEVVIRRLMVTQPPIEGNLDCRARSCHSELCFDRATFRLQPELKDSFHLLQRYHMEHLMTPRDFFYPRVALDFYQYMTTHHVRDPTVIHFTIDGHHGILGARHIAEALRIPYEPACLEDYQVWADPSQSDMVHILSRRESTRPYPLRKELPPSMFFINALLRHNIYPLQHMEEAAESGCHSTSIPRLLCQILEHLGYPSEPHLERRRICREIFTLDKWTMPSTGPMPKVASSTPPAIPGALPVIPSTSESSPPSESGITISISEFRDLCHTLQTLTQQMIALHAHQEQIITTQTQHTAILRQIQQHLGIVSPPEHVIPIPSEPTHPS
ncbi:hypothetical protein CK203_104916 [Vitis vinifera]|uniref:Uncharacterized protein n=1 Tax=Vitis vinifera TaxID=29760 RepID=A0A438BN19_VITVI|nr:hypothetical protein CK203_104916 [Vitis vinifera]